MIKDIPKSWQDQTAGRSYFEGLNFPADRRWQECKIEFKSTKEKTKFEGIKVMIGSTVHKVSSFTLNENKSNYKSYTVNDCCSIAVDGYISRPLSNLKGAGGKVIVTCTYDENENLLESESCKWSDSTGGYSMIDNLFLEDNHLWESCKIRIEGESNKVTGCQVTLLVNGEIKKPKPDWVVLNGSESKEFFFPINGKATLVVGGYISNHMVVGGSARIILEGYYKKGE